MKKIKTKSGIVVILEIPSDANCFKKDLISVATGFVIKFSGNRVILLPFKNDFEIIGKLSKLTDRDCEEFVELLHDNTYIEEIKCWSGKFYYHYNQKPGLMNQLMYTAKQSFITLLQSEGIDTINEDKLLIIKILDENS